MTTCTTAIALLCILFVKRTSGHMPHMDGVDERVVHVIQTHTSGNRDRRSVDNFPSVLRLDILGMTDVVLLRKYEVTDHVPILLKRNSSVEQFRPNSKQSVAFYTNTSVDASFMTWHKPDSSELDVFGTFVERNEEYLLQTDTTSYTLARVPLPFLGQLDKELLVPSTLKHIKENNTATKTSRNKRRTTEYEVEVMVVVDFRLYSVWFAKMNGTDAEKKVDAFEKIRQYYAFILNGINVRYATLTGVSYTIAALYAGIYISDTADAASYIEPYTFYMPGIKRKLFSADNVIDYFRDWAVESLSSYSYDHAMMFTAYDMATTGSDIGFSSSTIGLAFLSGVCGNLRFSIIEDQINAIVSTIAAHELGHNLGASHDDEDKNTCSSKDSYIMSPTVDSSPTNDKIRNMWRFSKCSIDYFTKLINILNSKNQNCLLSRSSSYNTSLTDQYNGDISGQLYPPDKQCLYSFGDGFNLMRIVYEGNYSSICTKLYCFKPDIIDYYNTTLIAWDGTTCGNGKICSSGNCVKSANSSTGFDDTCLFGDMPYNIPYLNITCQEMINDPDQTYICYDAFFNNYCCASCKELKTRYANVTDTCLFGDMSYNIPYLNITCQEMINDPDQTYICYNALYNNYCCASCKELKTRYANVTDCLYGNHLSGCESSVPSSGCYNDAVYAGCCGTCVSRNIGITGCEYGDRATICQATSCPYYTDVLRTVVCCQTCNAPQTEVTDTTQAPKTKQAPTKSDEQAAVMTGIGIGVPLFIVLSAIILHYCLHSRRDRKLRREGRRYTEERNSENQHKHSHRSNGSELTRMSPKRSVNITFLVLSDDQTMPNNIGYYSIKGFGSSELQVTPDHHPRLPRPGI